MISGSGGLTKQGPLHAAGANTHTGDDYDQRGDAAACGGNAIADTGAVTLANVAGAVLNLNGTNETIGSLAGGGATGGNVSLGAGTLTTGDANNTTYSGVILAPAG